MEQSASPEGTFYHWSKAELAEGTVLESRFWKNSHVLEIVRDVLAIGPDALHLFMLSDDLMFERFPRWKDAGVARADKALQEVIFEQVREQSFPDRPSRIGGIFLFPALDLASRYRSEVQKGAGRILRLSVEGGELFSADMNLVTMPNPHRPIAPELQRLEKQANQYWSGEMAGNPWTEMLVKQGQATVRGTEL